MSSQKHDLLGLAVRLGRKARSDEIVIEKLADDPDVPDDLIGFHIQQALEKLLKAALASAGIAPPRIHDLGELVAQLRDANVHPPVSADAVRAFVPWAVEFRYDDVLDERLELWSRKRLIPTHAVLVGQGLGGYDPSHDRTR